MYNKKIKEAVKSGQLISHEDVLKSFSAEDQKEIKERAKYFMAQAKIIKLRKDKRLSQQALANKMNVKREFISRIESGNQNITLATLLKIATATGKEFKFSFE